MSTRGAGSSPYGWGGWAPAMLVLAAAFIAALPPLHEMDLAQHLATGEWIVQHRTVPFAEPFAWTREELPYFAYSWLMQVTFFLLLDAFGPIALHLLEAALVGSAVAAAYWGARQFRWSRATCFTLALLHLTLLWGVVNTLRPQQTLFIAVPLVWGLTARISRNGINTRRLLALIAVAAFAANSHIFFPLTMVPVGYFLLTHDRPRVWAAAGGAVLAGWLLSPYAFAWHRVFALNFGPNVLLSRPPSILEFYPGFEYAMQRPGAMIVAVVLLVVPWLSDVSDESVRTRAVRALYWTCGLVLFAYAGRLIAAWWFLAFPFVGDMVRRMSAAAVLLRSPRTRRAVTVGAAAALFIAAAPPISPVFWFFEGDTVHRMLPRGGEDPALWLPSWLLCNTRPQAAGRIYTEFNYGSELTWRLPGYSPSIDGRTIFPNAVARDFVLYPHGRQRLHGDIWKEADLALLDRTFWLAPVLDSDSEWLLIAEGRRTSRGSHGALWAKRTWWQEWGTADDVPAVDIRPGDPRGVCSATGRFPRGQASAGTQPAPPNSM